MKKRFFYRIGFVAAFVAVLGFASMAAQGADFTPKKEYKLSLVVGPTFPWGEGAEMFADLVRKKTDGKINIKVYYGGQLFKGEQTSEFQLMSLGAIDFAFGSTINWSGVIPELNVFSLPFFVRNYDRLDRLEQSEVGQHLFDLMDAKGVKPLAWAENGFRQITNSAHPIVKPEDMKGLKIRVVGSPIFIDIYHQLGADPVNMNWGDATTAFAQGVVDGQENPAGVLVPASIWEYHKYATFWDYLVDPVVVSVSGRVWDTFPPEIQKKIQAAATEAARWEKAMVRRGLDHGKALDVLKNYDTDLEFTDYTEYLRSKGMDVTVLDKAQKQDFRDALQPIYDKWVPEIGKELVENARAAMAEK